MRVQILSAPFKLLREVANPSVLIFTRALKFFVEFVA